MADLLEQPLIRSLNDLVDPRRRQYRVPLYQRDYEWEEDQVDDFAADLLGSARTSAEHFYGTVVLSKNAPGPDYAGTDDVRYVIDGQQRLTTALLALTALRHHAMELGDGEAAGMLRGLTCIDELTTNPRPKLFANRGNQRFLTEALVATRTSTDLRGSFAAMTDEERTSSNRTLNSYIRLRRHVAQHVLTTIGAPLDEDVDDIGSGLVNSSGKQRAAHLLRTIARALMDRSLFIEITVRSWEDAFSVFEGLNNRGLDLSERDLVKNSVLARAHTDQVIGEDLVKMADRWEELTGRVAESKFARFLRHYLLLHYEDVPLKRIVRMLNEHYQQSTAQQMIDDLDWAARAYERITRPSVEKNEQLRLTLRRFAALDADRSYPIVLAGMLKDLLPAELVRLIQAVEVLYFRRSAVMGKDNKSIETDIRNVAAELFNAGGNGMEQAVQAIRDLTPDDEEFKEQFVRRAGMKDSVARYMLVSMENHLSAEHVKQADMKVTLEHIMPKHPGRWRLSSADAELHHDTHNRLGNLTILRGRRNSSLGDRPFAEKRSVYETEPLAIDALVRSARQWTRKEIAERQTWMADVACEVWQR